MDRAVELEKRNIAWKGGGITPVGQRGNQAVKLPTLPKGGSGPRSVGSPRKPTESAGERKGGWKLTSEELNERQQKELYFWCGGK